MSGLVRRSAPVLVLVALLALTAGASANSYRVSIKGDPAPGACTKQNCSLREAISAANAHSGKDSVVLPSTGYKLQLLTTIEDDNLDGDLDITDPVIISHPGKGKATISANRRDRVFDVQSGSRTTFRSLRIRDGLGDGPVIRPPANSSRDEAARRGGASPEGGGIRNVSNIKVVDSLILNNRSASHGGGIGAIENAGVELIDSTVTKNFSAADSDGGGIDGASGKIVIKRSKITNNVSDRNGGGMYWAAGRDSKIEDSTISGNDADSGGGGIYTSEGPTLDTTQLKISGSTFSKNRASDTGGGIESSGGKLVAENSTFANNRTEGAGGAISLLQGKVKLNSVTVAYNLANSGGTADKPLGGGLFYGTGTIGFDVQNTLIALNRSGTLKNDCAGPDDFDSKGHNLLGTKNGCEGFDNEDRVQSNPRIGKLASNGGPTKTIALKKRSKAIDKAKESSAPKDDQRGEDRDKHPDIGAYER